jgi:hypothetical protein
MGVVVIVGHEVGQGWAWLWGSHWRWPGVMSGDTGGISASDWPRPPERVWVG